LDINKDEYVLSAFSLQGKERERVLSYWKSHSEYRVEEKEGIKEWYRNGERHRDDDLPAIESRNGNKFWYRNGKLHREGDLPAIECANGDKEWWKHGKLIREECACCGSGPCGGPN